MATQFRSVDLKADFARRNEPSGLDLLRSRVFRRGEDGIPTRRAAGHLPRERDCSAWRMAKPRISRRKCHRHPRRRWPGSRLLKRLPPSRVAAGRRHGRLRQGPDLPLPRLELRPRRAAGRRSPPQRISGSSNRGSRPQASRARAVARLPVRDAGARRALGRRKDGALFGRGRALSFRGLAGDRAGHHPTAAAQLEDDRRQLFRPSPHPDRASGADAAVRP